MNRQYQGYFSEPERLQHLSEAVAPCVDGTPSLSLSYDGATREGRVVLVVPAHQLRCGAPTQGASLDLSALVPLAAGLAAYRNDLAAWRDMRFYTFRTGIHVEDRAGSATLWLHGQDPIDGSAFHPCIGLDGVEHCVATGRETPDGLTKVPLPDAQLRRARALLKGRPR